MVGEPVAPKLDESEELAAYLSTDAIRRRWHVIGKDASRPVNQPISGLAFGCFGADRMACCLRVARQLLVSEINSRRYVASCASWGVHFET
jgi:hypothetical protein